MEVLEVVRLLLDRYGSASKYLQQRYQSGSETNLLLKRLHSFRSSEFLMMCDKLDSRPHGADPAVLLPLGAFLLQPRLCSEN